MLLYLFLFLFGTNIMLNGNMMLLVPFGVSVIKKKRIRVNITAILLIAFVIVYLIPEFVGADHPTYRLIYVPIAFLLGYNYFEELSEDHIISAYLVVAAGMAFHVLLSIILTFSRIGIHIGYVAVYQDIWSGTVTTATGLMSNLMLFLPLFIYALVKKGKYYAIIPFAAISVIFGIITGNRSTLILFVAASVIGIIIIFFNGQRRLSIAVVGIVLALLILVFLSYQFNWFGLRKMYDNSYLVYRMDINKANGESLFETQRWDTKELYLSKMLDYPWGGGKMREEIGSYAHDIWLDTWSWGGCFAFLILVIYIAAFIYRMVKFIRFSNDIAVKVLFSSYLAILLMQYLVEPILQGAPQLFISACLFDGLISRCLTDHEQKKLMAQV